LNFVAQLVTVKKIVMPTVIHTVITVAIVTIDVVIATDTIMMIVSKSYSNLLYPKLNCSKFQVVVLNLTYSDHGQNMILAKHAINIR
jgi:hypothetical protein